LNWIAIFSGRRFLSLTLLPSLLDNCLSEEDSNDGSTSKKRKRKTHDAKVSSLKAELKQLLSQPLVAKGVLTKYITSGVNPIVDELIQGECELSI
jgi:ATP-dependent RNA helicase DDX24/MAK5